MVHTPKILRSGVLATIVLPLFISSAMAGNIMVKKGGQYPTIQSGVDAASSGDTVLIHKGVYTERVTVSTPDLLVRPAKKGKKGKVTIDAGGNSSALFINADGVTVKNLVIANVVGYESVTMANCDGASLLGCTVQGGTADAFGNQYGVWCVNTTNCTIAKCKFIDTPRVAIYVGGPGSAGNIVKKNKVLNPGSIGMVISGLAQSVVCNKVISSGGVGLSIGDDHNGYALLNSLVSGNRIEDCVGRGISLPNGYGDDCVIDDNIIRGGSFGIWMDDTSNHLFVHNKTADSGLDGILIAGSSGTELHNNRSKDSGRDNFYFHSNTSQLTVVKNKSRRAGDDGFEVAGSDHRLLQNCSKQSAGLDFKTQGATNLLHLGNSYNTSDF